MSVCAVLRPRNDTVSCFSTVLSILPVATFGWAPLRAPRHTIGRRHLFAEQSARVRPWSVRCRSERMRMLAASLARPASRAAAHDNAPVPSEAQTSDRDALRRARRLDEFEVVLEL